jgi:hypothetical protein
MDRYEEVRRIDKESEEEGDSEESESTSNDEQDDELQYDEGETEAESIIHNRLSFETISLFNHSIFEVIAPLFDEYEGSAC